MKQENLIFVTYDSILNPVFEGQVIQPLLKKLNQNSNLKIYLISFEKNNITNETINQIIPQRENLIFIKYKRLPVLGKISLLLSALQLKKFLNKIKSYNLIARGPLAGWVALKSLKKQNCLSFTVQARGLIGVEYELIYPKKNFFSELRIKQFETIERQIYNNFKQINNFNIESITPALKDYIINKYQAKNDNFKIASDDFPDIIQINQKIFWRNEIRKNLNIENSTIIYCYNGSTKPWQSIDLTINFFKERLEENKNIFLLVLTQDLSSFKQLLIEENISEIYYKILKLKHEQVYKYLCASDYGLIFRKEHLANWISRPIKAMEYQAANLQIIHNNTVKWLIDLK